MGSFTRLKHLEEKRSYRRRRSRLKCKLRRGGILTTKQRIHYNLSHCQIYEPLLADSFLNIYVPKILCVIEDHNGTLGFLYKIMDITSNNKPKHLKIFHTNNEVIGLTASYLFDNIVQAYIARWKNRGVKVSIHGHVSKFRSVNNFLLSFGLLSRLKISSKFTDKDVDFDYWNKYVVFQVSGSSSLPYLKSEASTKLAGYFRKCLNHSNIDLTPHGYGMLVDAIGEIIGNAEEHSGSKPARWVVLGCYNKETAQCGFSIFNYGATIYESLSNPESTSASVLHSVTEVINSSKNILLKIKDNVFARLPEEPVWNVMALQDGISSKRTENGPDSTRGQGLMDVLEFVELLRSKNDPAKIAIISGRSKILSDFKYPIIRQTVNTTTGEKRRLLPFNKEGSLRKPFDQSNVFFMDHIFDGVIITGSFKINEVYLTTMLEKAHVAN